MGTSVTFWYRADQGKSKERIWKQTKPGCTHHKSTYLLELVKGSEWDRVADKKRARWKCVHLHFGRGYKMDPEVFILLQENNQCVWASLVVQLVKNPPAMPETLVRFLGWGDPWTRDRLPTPVFLGFPGGSDGKESSCNAGDLGSIPLLGRSPGGGHGNPLQ